MAAVVFRKAQHWGHCLAWQMDKLSCGPYQAGGSNVQQLAGGKVVLLASIGVCGHQADHTLHCIRKCCFQSLQHSFTCQSSLQYQEVLFPKPATSVTKQVGEGDLDEVICANASPDKPINKDVQAHYEYVLVATNVSTVQTPEQREPAPWNTASPTGLACIGVAFCN